MGKNEPVSIADEVPFEIPDSWEWCRCSTLGAMVRGKGIKRTETVADGFPCVRYGEIYTSYNLSFDKTISFIPEEVDKNCNHFGKNDIIFTLTGENKPDIAKAVVYAGEDKVAAGGDMAYWTCHGMNPYYLMYFLNSPYAIELKRRTATGDIIVHISTNKIGNFLIPVPPLSEQQRIIDKIHEVEPLINNYKRKSEKIDSTNTAFPELLKKSILQEAIKGKLVPQDENDEPASVLLERIRVEKQRLISEGKLKKDKHESIIYRRDNSHYEKLDGVERCIDNEIPFELPDSWEWIRLKHVAEIARGGSPRPIKDFLTDSDEGVNWIKIGDADKGGKYINSTKEKIIPEGVTKSRYVHAGDFLLTNSMSFGRPYILNVDGCIHDGWLVISSYQTAYNQDFLYYMLSSTFAYYQFCGVVSGAVVKNLNSEKVGDALFPLPPIKEQSRIVDIIESLLPHCEELK